MQLMIMKIHKHGVPDTNMWLSNTFKRFHVRLLRHLYYLWKLFIMSSVTDKQQATKLIDTKRKFMELMMRKSLDFF